MSTSSLSRSSAGGQTVRSCRSCRRHALLEPSTPVVSASAAITEGARRNWAGALSSALRAPRTSLRHRSALTRQPNAKAELWASTASSATCRSAGSFPRRARRTTSTHAITARERSSSGHRACATRARRRAVRVSPHRSASTAARTSSASEAADGSRNRICASVSRGPAHRRSSRSGSARSLMPRRRAAPVVGRDTRDACPTPPRP